MLALILSLFGTCLDSTLLRVLAWILPFPALARTPFLYSPGFYHSPVLAHVLTFYGTHLDSTFLGTLPDPFSLLTRILPFFGTCLHYTFPNTHPDPFSVLVRILPFSGTSSDSTFFQYSLDSTFS